MPSDKVLEQHAAVFSESGSGKAVMLSSFCCCEQEPQSIKKGAFDLVAENASQGTRLHQSYLGMTRVADQILVVHEGALVTGGMRVVDRSFELGAAVAIDLLRSGGFKASSESDPA